MDPAEIRKLNEAGRVNEIEAAGNALRGRGCAKLDTTFGSRSKQNPSQCFNDLLHGSVFHKKEHTPKTSFLSSFLFPWAIVLLLIGPCVLRYDQLPAPNKLTACVWSKKGQTNMQKIQFWITCSLTNISASTRVLLSPEKVHFT